MLDEQTAVIDFTWASYDGTTNAPILYPSGTSITEMEDQLLMQIAPASLAPGTNSVPYEVAFSGTGGQPPYSWSLAPQSPALPLNFSLAPDGTFAGTPMSTGAYFFTVRMTDAGSRFLDASYVLTISP